VVGKQTTKNSYGIEWLVRMLIASMCMCALQFEYEIGEKVESGGRPDLERLPKVVPPQLVELLKRCWAADPDVRPDFPIIQEALSVGSTLNTPKGDDRTRRGETARPPAKVPASAATNAPPPAVAATAAGAEVVPTEKEKEKEIEV
jgi:hypothetical protein